MVLAEFKPEIFRMLVDKLSTQSPPFSLWPGPSLVMGLMSKDFDVEKIRVLLERATG